MLRRALYVLVGLSTTACAVAGASSSRPFSTSRRDVLSAAEIVASRVTDAYQAVTQLRPEFLRRRGVEIVPRFSGSVTVYLDDLPQGGLESLRYIPLDRVRLIRYMTPSDADIRWGGSHPAGAILVTTVR